MADGPLRFPQSGPNLFYNSQSPRRNNSPRNPRRPYTPNSPPLSSAAVNVTPSQPSNMFQHGYQNQNHMMNGAQNHQRFNNMQMHKHHNQQFAPQGPMGHQHAQHHNPPMHQHNISGGFTNPAHHALGFADHMNNGGSDAMSHDENEDLDNSHWRDQQQALNECRELSGPNQRARQFAATARGVSFPITDDGNNGQSKAKVEWTEMDLGGQGLRALAPKLFDAYGFLKRLDLAYNNLTVLPTSLGRLKNLEHLDVSFNQLSELPAEIGMLTNLKQLHLFHNRVQTLCYELGFLFKLETLGVLGNPLEAGQKEKITEGGTKALIHHLKESMPGRLHRAALTTLLTRSRTTTSTGAGMAST